MTAPLKWAKEIKAWADGIDVQYRGFIACEAWSDLLDGEQPNFFGSAEWRIKPAAPKWPASTLPEQEAKIAFYGSNEPNLIFANGEGSKRLADAAVAHALESQQVVLMREVQDIARELNKNLREKEKMAVATAVRDAAFNAGVTWSFCGNESSDVRAVRTIIGSLNLPSIIASVKLP